MVEQTNLHLLDDPVAKELLSSSIPARVAYIGNDNKPRVVPLWFYWNGHEIVLGTPIKAPKVQAIPHHAEVALTIDSNTWPYHVLSIRGTAHVETVKGLVPEYEWAAVRYLGEEGGKGWIEQARKLFPQMARIVIQPEWVNILDFETRVPGAIAAAMAGA